jgi:hypothetical protein
MSVYVYAHFRSSNNSCFYVGKGTGRRVRAQWNRNNHWKRCAEKHGWWYIVLKVFEHEAEAYAYEVLTIERYRAAGHKLSNRAEGGAGPTGASWSPEARARLSATHKKRPRPPMSAETKAKISAARKGKPLQGEHRARFAKIAANPSAETRAKISAAGRGRSHTDETKLKIGAAHRGKVVSEETREKMRRNFTGRKNPALSARWQDPEWRAFAVARLKAGWAAKRAMKEAAHV